MGRQNDELTIEQVKELFGVTTMTIWKWRRDHGFPETRYPKGEHRYFVRFPRKEVLRWARETGRAIRSGTSSETRVTSTSSVEKRGNPV